MGLLQGSISLRRFLVLGEVPGEDAVAEGLSKHRFRPFPNNSEDEESVGWADWRNPLIVPADKDWLRQGRYAVFALRMESRKVPPALVKAHTELRMQKLMKQKDLAFVGREAKLSIEDEVRSELIKQVLPVPRVADVAWDLKGGMLFTTAGSSKAQENLVILMKKSFGVEIQLVVPLSLAGRVAPGISVDDLLNLEPLDFSVEAS